MRVSRYVIHDTSILAPKFFDSNAHLVIDWVPHKWV
jgi:hypothetical protein